MQRPCWIFRGPASSFDAGRGRGIALASVGGASGRARRAGFDELPGPSSNRRHTLRFETLLLRWSAPVTERDVLKRLNCGRIKFGGSDSALYESHLTFDHVTPAESATPRDRFEAVAR